MEEKPISEIFACYQGQRTELLAIMLDLQENLGYLSPEAIIELAKFLSISEGEVHSVASFYAQFRFNPIGKKRICVCRGTACHIRGAPDILNEIEHTVGIAEGETTEDREYSLETVACIGCCALAPCVKINEDVHGDMNRDKARGLLNHRETHGG